VLPKCCAPFNWPGAITSNWSRIQVALREVVDVEPLEVAALERKMRPSQANEDHAALDPAAAHGSLQVRN
jgi:hypothetical protein